MKHGTDNFITRDKLTLFVESWSPEKKPKAVVCIIHGIGDRIGRFENLAKDLCADNFAVIGFDQRGSGKSEGKYGHIPSYQALLDDITDFLSKARELFPNQKYFLYSHSHGGNQIANYILRETVDDITGAVITSPWLKLPFKPSWWKLWISKILNVIIPGITFNNELDYNDISRNKNVNDQFRNDPLTHNRISPRNFLSVNPAGMWAIQNACNLTIPVLLMHGTSDKITSHLGSKEFAENASSQLCTLKLWEGSYHAIHDDINRDEIIRFTIEWLNEHI